MNSYKRAFQWTAVALLVGAASTGTNFVSVAMAQAPNGAARSSAPLMRTRMFSSLTGYEVEQYLQRNDVIYVPIGPTETHGGFPIDCEYVAPLAYATKLAEKTDGLVFPYLAYFYPGGTTVSRATVNVSTSESLPYLKALTRSLIRQGFRRIVYLSGHGPSGNTITPLVRETFDETHVPVVWLDLSVLRDPKLTKITGVSNDKIFYGAYYMLGRLDDIPVGLAQPPHEFQTDPSFAKVEKLLGGGNSIMGNFYADPSEHGGWPTAITVAQREQYAREGLRLIEAGVANFDAAGLLQAMRNQDKFTQYLTQKYGDALPPGPLAPKK